MNTLNRPEIVIEATRSYTRWGCDFCGDIQDKDGMLSQVVVYEKKFDICRNCLESGQHGVIERVHLESQRLREQADFMDSQLVDVILSIQEWKTGADYDACRDKREVLAEAQELIEEANEILFGEDDDDDTDDDLDL